MFRVFVGMVVGDFIAVVFGAWLWPTASTPEIIGTIASAMAVGGFLAYFIAR